MLEWNILRLCTKIFFLDRKGKIRDPELCGNTCFTLNVRRGTKFVNTHLNPLGGLREKKVRIHELRRPGNEKKVISAALVEIRGSFIYIYIYGPLWQEDGFQPALTGPSGIENLWPYSSYRNVINLLRNVWQLMKRQEIILRKQPSPPYVEGTRKNLSCGLRILRVTLVGPQVACVHISARQCNRNYEYTLYIINETRG
jgi:hypothetical protein